MESAAPDWSVAADVFCPVCNYNLRGLTQPRCPECGFEFQWRQLTEAHLRRHEYLFEHHPERNFRSFWATWSGTLRPRRFWARVYPTQPSHVGRLLVFWLLTALPVVLVSVGGLQFARRVSFTRTWGSPYRPTPMQLYWSNPNDPVWVAMVGTICLIWPWATMMTMMIFTTTMDRLRIRPSHVLRCMLYSFDLGIALALAQVLLLLGFLYPHQSQRDWLKLNAAVCAGFVLVCIYRVFVAYRVYLRLGTKARRSAMATVVAAQIVVGLGVVTVLAASSDVIVRLLWP